MTESQVLALITQVVRSEISKIRLSTIVQNESQTRMQTKPNKTEGPIGKIRSVQPFGVSSRANPGTAVVQAPIGNDPTHVVTLGHFDENRPTGADGETLLYNAYGQLVYLSNGKIQIGTKAAAENLVLGQVFKTFASQVLQLIIDHKHIGNLGYETSPPENAADFSALKSSPIDDSLILSDISFTEKG